MRPGVATMMTAALVALAGASLALAAGSSVSVRLTGLVPGDGETVVRVTAVEQDGATKLVKRFRFKKVLATCEGADEPQRITVRLTGRIPVVDREYERTFNGGASGKVRISGRVSRDGQRTVGVVRSPAIAVAGVGVCELPPTAFRAST